MEDILKERYWLRQSDANIAAGKIRIQEQAARVAAMERAGLDTEAARKLLDLLRTSVQTLTKTRSQILEHIERLERLERHP